MRDLIAVTGASGALGRRVVKHLGGRGARLRLVVRERSRAPALPGAEIAVARYERPDELQAAFRGATTLFLVSAHEAKDRMSLHRNAVEAALRARVERVVYTSYMGAAPNATFTYARDHAHTERAIRDAGLALTSLRDSMYADVAPLFVGKDGVIRGPAANGRIAWVAREDVARLASAVLLDASHAGETYDVSGPRAIDLEETAWLLAQATGKPIRYEAETLEAARASRAGAGVEPWEIEGWVSSYLAIATGETSVTSHTIERVTGTAPLSFEEFLRAEPAALHHLIAP